MVVTSSFHGTAFALNYGRPLVSITPSRDDDRQSNILAQLGLQQCRLKVSEGIAMGSLNPFYDAIEEQKNLQRLREGSLLWIKQSLK